MQRRTVLTSLLLVGLLGCTGKSTEPQAGKTALTDPAAATATAPNVFRVEMVTTKGDVVVEVHRDWAPPDQTQIEARGNAYLRESFPQLDDVKTARVLP